MKTWPNVCLAEVADIISGSTPSRNRPEYWGGDIPWLTPTDLPGRGIAEVSGTSEQITQAGLQSCSTTLLPIGTVMYSSRASIGKIGIAKVPTATNQGFKSFVPGKAIESRYMAYALLHFTSDIERLAGKTTFKEISKSAISAFEIPLPPPSEQRRITALLDWSDALRARRTSADQLAGTILPSLFGCMFGEPLDNPRGWQVVPLGELIAEGPQNGLYKPKSDYGEGTPILRIDGFYDGHISDLQALQRVRLSEDEQSKYALRVDDIVINRVNSEEYLGKSALVRELLEPTVFESNMMRFSVDEERIHPLFLINHLQTPAIKAQILQKAKRAINQASINQGDVQSFSILLPPLELQEAFAARAQRVERIIRRQARSRESLDVLFHTLLHRAFSGELTASWREAHAELLRVEQEEQAVLLGLAHQQRPNG